MWAILLELGFATVAVISGATAGWWLRSRNARRNEARVNNDEIRRAHEVLTTLQKLSAKVASELGAHQGRVEEINEELLASRPEEPDVILRTVTKLVDVNRTMQSRLDEAEDRLREQARLAESSAAEARTDALTLIGNRRAFDAEIARRFEEFRNSGSRFVLAMIDLDKFKRINDTFGHPAGDEILRGVARVLRRTMRDGDTIARYGG